MKNDYIVKVVSYKRPKNLTCDALLKTNLNWKVYVYSFDASLNEYLLNYKEHVRVIDEMTNANLASKRQLVLDDCIKDNYKYCIIFDDDVYDIQLMKHKVNINIAVKYLLFIIKYFNKIKKKRYVNVGACYQQKNYKVVEYKTSNSCIFDIDLYKESKVKYNPQSKIEDVEFTIELILHNYKVARDGKLYIKNKIQSGVENDNTGLCYRFENNKRANDEVEYLKNKYPELKDIIKQHGNYTSIKTNKIKEILNNEN